MARYPVRRTAQSALHFTPCQTCSFQGHLKKRATWVIFGTFLPLSSAALADLLLRFYVIVFLLLDHLPTKANELDLPSTIAHSWGLEWCSTGTCSHAGGPCTLHL